MTENQPARSAAGAAGAPGTSRNAVARRGDLVVIHLRHREWKDGRPREYDDFWLGQVTSVTRAGLVRLYRPAGTFAWETDGRGRPGKGQPLPSLWFERAAIKSQKEIDVPGVLATAACHTWPGHEDHVCGYATLAEVKAALRPHLLESAGWEPLHDPSGLPETSPAGDGGEPGEAEELAAWAAGLGLQAGDLDDLVHDVYSKQASETNNDGFDAQVKFLFECYGTKGARSLLSELLPQTERARLRRRAEQRPPPALRG